MSKGSQKPLNEDSLFNNLENISAQLDSLDLENQQNIDGLEALVFAELNVED